MSSLQEEPYTDLTQNSLSDLAILWGQFSASKKKKFRETYGDIASLISVPIEEPLLRAAMRFWDPSYRCFTFGKNDLVPTIEEYSVLIGLELQHPDKVYNRKSRARWRKALAQILKVPHQTIDTYMVQKGNRQGISWNVLQNFIQEHLHDDHGPVAFTLAIYGLIIFPRGQGYIETTVIKVFQQSQHGSNPSLAIYGLIIFPRGQGYIETAVVEVFQQIQHGSNPSLAILAETFRSLNYCCRNKDECF